MIGVVLIHKSVLYIRIGSYFTARAESTSVRTVKLGIILQAYGLC